MSKKAKSKVATVGITAAVVVLLFIVGLVSWNCSVWFNRPVEEKKIESIREEVVPIAQLSTYEYNFTQILHYSTVNNDNPFAIEIPFSKNNYVASIEGTTTIYTNTEDMIVEPAYTGDGKLAEIKITLPHAEVKQPVALDFSTLYVYEDRNGFLNEITDEQKNDLLIKTNEEQVAKVQASGLLNKADYRVQELISTQLKNIYGEDVDISFNYIN